MLSIMVALAVLPPASPIQAQSFTVTKTADTNDGDCDGDCSLREAISAVNGLTGGPHTINLPAGTYTVTGFGTLQVSVNASIVGAGQGTTVVDGETPSGSSRSGAPGSSPSRT